MTAGGTVTAIVAGELWHGSTLRGLAQGLRNLGWIVNEVGFAQDHDGGNALVHRAVRRIATPMNARQYNRRIVEAAERSGADFLITVKGAHISADTLGRLRARGTRSINYYPDPHFDYSGVSEALVLSYDFVATTKHFQVEFLASRIGAARALFLEHGYSPLVHRPMPRAGRRVDVAYLGNATAYKAAWLNQLARDLPDISLAVAGAGWDRHAEAALAPHLLGHAMMGDSAAAFLSGARINVALHAGPLGPDGAADDVSTRTFEIPSCRGFMLHIDNRHVRELFDVGTEIDVFSTPGQLVERVRHYLANPERAAMLAEAGYRRAVPAYSLDARAAKLARFVGAD